MYLDIGTVFTAVCCCQYCAVGFRGLILPTDYSPGECLYTVQSIKYANDFCSLYVLLYQDFSMDSCDVTAEAQKRFHGNSSVILNDVIWCPKIIRNNDIQQHLQDNISNFVANTVTKDARVQGPHLNIKTVILGINISVIKTRRSPDFIMGTPILVRRRLYIEMGPCRDNDVEIRVPFIYVTGTLRVNGFMRFKYSYSK